MATSGFRSRHAQPDRRTCHFIAAGVAPAQAEIVVGFVTGLSGPLSSIGIPNSKGIAAGGVSGQRRRRKICLIQLDDVSDLTNSAQNARKLSSNEKVDFLIGTSGAPQHSPSRPRDRIADADGRRFPRSPAARRRRRPVGRPNSPAADAARQGRRQRHEGAGLKTIGFIGFSDALGDLMHNSLVANTNGTDVKAVNDERYARTDNTVVRPGPEDHGAEARRHHDRRDGDARRLADADARRARLATRAWSAANGVMSQDFCASLALRPKADRPDRPGDRRRAIAGCKPDQEGRARLSRGLRKANGSQPTGRFLALRLRRLGGVLDAANALAARSHRRRSSGGRCAKPCFPARRWWEPTPSTISRPPAVSASTTVRASWCVCRRVAGRCPEQ